MLHRGVLVLNRQWMAIHVCTVRRALSLVFQDLARVVTEDYRAYDFEAWRDFSMTTPDGVPHVRTPNFSLRTPQVIVLSRYSRVPPRRVRFNRRNIFLRDAFTCQYCEARPPHGDLTIDHVVPRSRGGASSWDNVVVACMNCNTRKGGLTLEEAAMKLVARPKAPHWLACLHFTAGPTERAVWKRFLDGAI
ncbi:MAG: HNH endonuclease [Candidatus Sumerlaeota bacterium]|nr:HNH endonuclease [Candidatus Sumerlaeota bacterium]